jgi:hypothetical protein
MGALDQPLAEFSPETQRHFARRRPRSDDSSFAKTIPNFYFALKEHLRDGVIQEELHLDDMSYADEIDKVRHIPNLIAAHLQQRITDLAA